MISYYHEISTRLCRFYKNSSWTFVRRSRFVHCPPSIGRWIYSIKKQGSCGRACHLSPELTHGPESLEEQLSSSQVGSSRTGDLLFLRESKWLTRFHGFFSGLNILGLFFLRISDIQNLFISGYRKILINLFDPNFLHYPWVFLMGSTSRDFIFSLSSSLTEWNSVATLHMTSWEGFIFIRIYLLQIL